jgi:hypothetical protein
MTSGSAPAATPWTAIARKSPVRSAVTGAARGEVL